MRRSVMHDERILIEVIEELTKSGTWTAPPGCYTVDAFLVGGGGGGSCYVDRASQPNAEANGGGGGYCNTFYKIPVLPGSRYAYTIGAGGKGGSTINGKDGGYTQFANSSYRVNGGSGGKSENDINSGGNGGSGGGAGGGSGGTNGSDGVGKNSNPGYGQSSSTRCPFSGYESVNFSGGGGSAGDKRGYGYAGDDSAGNSTNNLGYPGGRISGKNNRGGGGGGAWSVSLNSYDISGGSGIIILRYKRYE